MKHIFWIVVCISGIGFLVYSMDFLGVVSVHELIKTKEIKAFLRKCEAIGGREYDFDLILGLGGGCYTPIGKHAVTTTACKSVHEDDFEKIDENGTVFTVVYDIGRVDETHACDIRRSGDELSSTTRYIPD
ncbi:MAG: hypothetical protein Q7S76_01120 [bacterium]|nr:hypothetical protein [bacterium]